MASYKNNCDYCSIRLRFLFHTLRFKSIMPLSLSSLSSSPSSLLLIFTHCRYNQSKRKNAIALHCLASQPSCSSLYLFAANINQEMVFKCRPLVELMRFKSKENIFKFGFDIDTTRCNLFMHILGFARTNTLPILDHRMRCLRKSDFKAVEIDANFSKSYIHGHTNHL